MTRTNAREIAIHMIFELGFSKDSAQTLLTNKLNKEYFAMMAEETKLYREFPNKKQRDYMEKMVEGTFVHSPELDEYISKYAKNWSFSRIPRVIAAIMRVAMFEAMYVPEIPVSVAVNDAVEIAKGYDEPEVISFMNGVLRSFVREECASLDGKAQQLKEEDFEETPTAPEESPVEVTETEDGTEILSMSLEGKEGEEA